MLKPDAVRRDLIGIILSRFEDTGLNMEAMNRLNVSSEQSSELYKEHEGKPFYANLIDYIHSGPVVATVWSGPSAVSIARKLIGATVNGTGSLLMRVEKVDADSLLAQIINMVAEAQRTRAPIQKLADVVAA